MKNNTIRCILHLMVLFFKAFLNHSSKRQILVLHSRQRPKDWEKEIKRRESEVQWKRIICIAIYRLSGYHYRNKRKHGKNNWKELWIWTNQKYLCIGEDVADLKIGNVKRTENRKQYRYLGIVIKNNGHENIEIINRKTKMRKMFKLLNSIWCSEEITGNRK